MVTVSLCGGTGNQVRQFYFGQLLKQLGNEVSYDLSYFGRSDSRAYALDHWTVEVNPGPRLGKSISEPDLLYHPELLKKYDEDVTLDGYWQAYKYLDGIEDYVRATFRLRESLDEASVAFARQMLHTNSVAMHVRRTDSLAARGLSFHGVCSGEYYAKAIEYVVARVTDPHFFVFSDDIAWCKENITDFGFPLTFVDCNSTGVTVLPDNEVQKTDNGTEHFDLWLMRCCKHAITANSSFSWWGAWLRKLGVKVSPLAWFTPENNWLSKDMIPWHRI